MSSKTYNFGYELKSKQVRVYQTNDIGSVRRALTANVQEYLAYEGIEEENPISLKSLLLKILTIGAAAGVYVLNKKKVYGAPLVGSFLLFGVLLASQIAYNILQNNEDIFFVGTGRAFEEGSRSQKPCFRNLANQRLRVRLTQDSVSIPVVRFEVQLIGPSSLFSRPSVYSQVEKTVQYGQFFGSTGFFFPPPLLELVDGLLESAVSKKRK